MKLQQLCRETSTPVSTVKFYLREGLLPPGRKLNATTAAYGPEHVDRLELIRALRQVVGLELDRVRQVIEAVETLEPVRMMGRVQSIVLGLPTEPTGEPLPAEGFSSGRDAGVPDRLTAQDILEAMGWRGGTPESLRALDDQLAAMAEWALAPSLDTALVYARAVDRVARHELSSGAPWATRPEAPATTPGTGGDGPASGMPSADRIAAYTAVGVHGYAQLLLRLLTVAQGSHARNLEARS